MRRSSCLPTGYSAEPRDRMFVKSYRFFFFFFFCLKYQQKYKQNLKW